jgi:hypothetical protein
LVSNPLEPFMSEQHLSASRTTQSEPAAAGDVFSSGVAWSAVIAGAVGNGALSLILVLLGIGLGFALVTPRAARRPRRSASARFCG